MARIKKIIRCENKGETAVIHVQLEDGLVAEVWVGGSVEVYHDPAHDKIKAFVKKTKGLT